MYEPSLLKWSSDPQSAAWAKMICLLRSDEPQAQYIGGDLWEATWVADILRESFPAYCQHSTRTGYLLCSPQNITKCFSEGRVLEALALTVSWGGMARTKRHIYDYSKPDHAKAKIERTLHQCMATMASERSAEQAWLLLTQRLSWTDVISSKCLHFMARALGYIENPPVPIDGRIIARKVWPSFLSEAVSRRTSASAECPASAPLCWTEYGYPWETYNRYMTVIHTWAEQRGWTTTEVENTLFSDWR